MSSHTHLLKLGSVTPPAHASRFTFFLSKLLSACMWEAEGSTGVISSHVACLSAMLFTSGKHNIQRKSCTTPFKAWNLMGQAAGREARCVYMGRKLLQVRILSSVKCAACEGSLLWQMCCLLAAFLCLCPTVRELKFHLVITGLGTDAVVVSDTNDGDDNTVTTAKSNNTINIIYNNWIH